MWWKTTTETTFPKNFLQKLIYLLDVWKLYKKRKIVILICAAYCLWKTDITTYKNLIVDQKYCSGIKYEYGMKISRWRKNLKNYPVRKNGVFSRREKLPGLRARMWPKRRRHRSRSYFHQGWMPFDFILAFIRLRESRRKKEKKRR